jgi:hypothetical protein
MLNFFLWLDPYLIRLYRLTGSASADFFLGTLGLAFLAIIIGKISIFLALLAIRKPVNRVAAEAKKYQNLSLEALKAGNKPAYTAANKLANDAFGKFFFQQMALSAGFLWPVFFALAWMQYRFADIEFPLPFMPLSLGFIGIFILLYALAYLMLKQMKILYPRLPYSRRIKEIAAGQNKGADATKGFADLPTPAQPDEKP